MEERPKIGVAVVVVQNGKILLGKRKNAHGAGEWSTPGGHLEFGESVEECAARELLEETGLKAISLKSGPWVNNVIEGRHYVTFFVFVESYEGVLETLEPVKCEGWEWFCWNELPSPLFPTVRHFIEKKDPHFFLYKLLEFYRERDWEQFHSPKNLTMDLASEMGELIEPFRWLTEKQSYDLDEQTKSEVADEIADVFKTLIYLSHKLGIDPVEASFRKLEKQEKKYPASACKGKALKYTAYES